MEKFGKLVLNRGPGESVIIETKQGLLKMTYVKNKGKQITVSFEGSKEFLIAREEVYVPSGNVSPRRGSD